MTLKNTLVLILVVAFTFACSSKKQVEKAEEKTTLERFEQHLNYMASDELHGRLTGSKYEQMAANYIAEEFESIGLAPLDSEKSYFSKFTFYAPFEIGQHTKLTLAGKDQVLDSDYYPVPISGNGQVEGKAVHVDFGIIAPDLKHDDYAGKNAELNILLLNLASPDGHHPHSKFKAYNSWRKRVEMAIAAKPRAIILYNSPENISISGLKAHNNITREGIPIIHVATSLAEFIIAENLEISLAVQLKREEKEGTNVVGFLNNKAERTVVIGAHYDHLGHGEYGNSRAPNSTEIHNGADDNASGTAMVMEMAREISNSSDYKNSNYIFIAFSGEELGLLGSSAFCKAAGFGNLKISYMLNFDMVGRLGNNGAPELELFGTGTSPAWDSLLNIVPESGFKINTETDGLGSSDHSSFYIEEVPAIHYFTGSHEDYHKPSDDVDKINFDGMQLIMNHAMRMAKELDDDSILKFTKTKNKENKRSYSSLKVTLGIMPSYTSNEHGLLIDAVTDGKPAMKAGIQKGDIVVRMDSQEVKDMNGYMLALGNYDKGDTAQVEVLRNGELMVLTVQF